jgi:hypothetical protein
MRTLRTQAGEKEVKEQELEPKQKKSKTERKTDILAADETKEATKWAKTLLRLELRVRKQLARELEFLEWLERKQRKLLEEGDWYE